MEVPTGFSVANSCLCHRLHDALLYSYSFMDAQNSCFNDASMQAKNRIKARVRNAEDTSMPSTKIIRSCTLCTYALCEV